MHFIPIDDNHFNWTGFNEFFQRVQVDMMTKFIETALRCQTDAATLLNFLPFRPGSSNGGWLAGWLAAVWSAAVFPLF